MFSYQKENGKHTHKKRGGGQDLNFEYASPPRWSPKDKFDSTDSHDKARRKGHRSAKATQKVTEQDQKTEKGASNTIFHLFKAMKGNK